MQFHPDLCEKIIARTKTQTRRIVKPGQGWQSDYSGYDRPIKTMVVTESRIVYQVGKTYAVCPGRGKSALWYAPLRTAEGVHNKILTGLSSPLMEALAVQARIKILQIWRENVRKIDPGSAIWEGFPSPLEFLRRWVGMHDQSVTWYEEGDHLRIWTATTRNRPTNSYKPGWTEMSEPEVFAFLNTRPAERYNAWALTFELTRK